MSFISSLWGDIQSAGTLAQNINPFTNIGNGIGNAIGNWLFGSSPIAPSGGQTGTTGNTPTNNPFNAGWPQLFSNLLVIVIGIVLIFNSMKSAPSLKTTVNVISGKSKVKSGAAEAAEDTAETAAVAVE